MNETVEVNKDKEEEVLNAQRQEMIDQNPDMEKLFQNADASLIEEYHAKLKEKQSVQGASRDIGADMQRSNAHASSDRKRTAEYISNVKKQVSTK